MDGDQNILHVVLSIIIPLILGGVYLWLRKGYESRTFIWTALPFICLMFGVGAIGYIVSNISILQNLDATTLIVAIGLLIGLLIGIIDRSSVLAIVDRRIDPSHTIVRKHSKGDLVDFVSKQCASNARKDILMFCGMMSFFDDQELDLKRLVAKGFKIKSLVRKSTERSDVERYRRALDVGIQIKYYPSNELDPGIRGRIIDGESNDNPSIILITRLPPNEYQTTHIFESRQIFAYARLFDLLWHTGEFASQEVFRQ